MVVCIPSGSTEVEIRAVRDSSEHAGGRDVYMIYEPMAAALGIGLDVEAPRRQHDSRHRWRQYRDRSHIAPEESCEQQEYIRIAEMTSYDIKGSTWDVSTTLKNRLSTMAEHIKINVGSAIPDLENPPEPFIVNGPNRMNSLLLQVPVTHEEISHCIDKTIVKME